MNKVTFIGYSWDDYVEWQTQDRNKLKKINDLLLDIWRNGNRGIGKSEPLKGNLSGWWSRRIDKENRIIYRIIDDTLEILQCGRHYEP